MGKKIEIDGKIYDKIIGFCTLNEITEPISFINQMLLDGLNIKMFGKTPFTQSDILPSPKKVEVLEVKKTPQKKKVEKSIEIPTIPVNDVSDSDVPEVITLPPRVTTTQKPRRRVLH